jgi:hypothetical protein
MGKVGWVVLGGFAGILLGKFVFSLPWPAARVADLQDFIDPINPEVDEPIEIEGN